MTALDFTTTGAMSDVNVTRATISTFRNRFIQSGLVQTGDTNQIDVATVPAIGLWSWTAQNLVYRFDDSLQTTSPIFLSTAFGSTSGGEPAIRFIIGTGSNGSGTVTNPSSAFQMYASGTGQQRHRISCNSGQFTLGFSYQSGRQGFISIERTKNTDGTPNGDGFIILLAYNDANQNIRQAISYIYSVNLWTTFAPGVMPPPSGSTGVYGNQCGVYPVHAFRGGQVLRPFIGCLAYFPSNLTTNTPVVVSHYGQNRTYIPLGNSGNLALLWTPNPNISLMILGE